MDNQEKKWGGARKGAGRKKKGEEKIAVPLPNGDEFFFETNNHIATIGGSNHHYNKAYRQLRESVEQLFKMGKVLKAPTDLDEDAKEEWQRLMICYASQDNEILSTLDTTMLRLFCESKGRYMKAYKTWKDLLQGNIVVENEKVQRYINECMKTMRKEADLMKSMANDLGLTLTGRAKMGILAMKAQQRKDEDEQSQLADLFGGM